MVPCLCAVPGGVQPTKCGGVSLVVLLLMGMLQAELPFTSGSANDVSSTMCGLAMMGTCGPLQPLVLERVPEDTEARQGGPASWIHTKVTLRRCSHIFKNIQVFKARLGSWGDGCHAGCGVHRVSSSVHCAQFCTSFRLRDYSTRLSVDTRLRACIWSSHTSDSAAVSLASKRGQPRSSPRSRRHSRACAPAAQAMYRVSEPTLGLLRGCAPCMAAQPVGTLRPDQSEGAHYPGAAFEPRQPPLQRPPPLTRGADESDVMQPPASRAGAQVMPPTGPRPRVGPDDREHSHAGGRGPAAWGTHPDDGLVDEDHPSVSDLYSERELDPPELWVRSQQQQQQQAAEQQAAAEPAAGQGSGDEQASGGGGGKRVRSNVVPAPRRTYHTHR